eukprot:scaffold2455_cov212-Chaetoceros_neogracile.AAC.49
MSSNGHMRMIIYGIEIRVHLQLLMVISKSSSGHEAKENGCPRNSYTCGTAILVPVKQECASQCLPAGKKEWMHVVLNRIHAKEQKPDSILIL